MALVETKKICKSFGGLHALREIDLTIERGEFVGLIGPNGAGKTTLINVLTGYYKPTSGRLILDGEDVTGTRMSEIAKKGVVRTFQQAYIFKDLPVLHNAIIGHHQYEHPGFFEGLLGTRAHKKRLRDCEAKAVEALEFVGLGDVKYERAGSLPYGSQKILGMAIAASADPKVLLLDEPVTGLNAVEITQTLALVKKLQEQKKMGVLIIEHHVRALMGFCDRVVVLNFGNKIADDTPEKIRQNEAVINAYLGEELDVA